MVFITHILHIQNVDKKSTNIYRAISVMPSIAKIFSTIIKDKIEEHMDNYCEEQSGFWKVRSCLGNIFIIRPFIEKETEEP